MVNYKLIDHRGDALSFIEYWCVADKKLVGLHKYMEHYNTAEYCYDLI